MYNMTCVTDLQQNCQQFQSGEKWKLGQRFLHFLTFFWHETSKKRKKLRFLADRTNGRAYATVLRLSVVCDVMYCG